MRHRHLLPLTEHERHGQIRDLNLLYWWQRDLNEPLGSCGQIDSVVFTTALFYFWLFTLPRRCHLTGRLWEDPLPSFQDQEKISLLSCSKCFIQQMLKKKFKRELTRILSTCFSAAKRQTGRSQTCSLVTWEAVEIRVKKQDLLVQGCPGPLSLNAHQCLYGRVWFCCVSGPKEIEINSSVLIFLKAPNVFFRDYWTGDKQSIISSDICYL